MKTFILVLFFTFLTFAQEKQDSVELANISNAYQKTWQEVQQLLVKLNEIDYAIAKGKATLFDLQNEYTAKVKAIEEKKKKK